MVYYRMIDYETDKDNEDDMARLFADLQGNVVYFYDNLCSIDAMCSDFLKSGQRTETEIKSRKNQMLLDEYIEPTLFPLEKLKNA